VKFGTFYLFSWHESKSQEQVIRDAIELIKISEELGFDSAWLAEHHFSRYGLGSAVLTLAGHVAAVTQRIRIGTAVVVLPFYNPITLAEEVATVDLLSGGRLELGIGRGYQWSEFNQLNISLGESRERFDESLEIMRLAWTEDEFDYHGKYWTFNGIKPLPKPLQKPHPPITVATSTPDGFRNAAARGQNILGGGSTTELETIQKNINLYRATLAEAGYAYDPARIKVQRPVFVADSSEAARAYFEERYMWFLQAQRKVTIPSPEIQARMTPDERVNIERFVKHVGMTFDTAFDEIGVFGPPEECVKRIEAVDNIVGGLEHFICSFAIGGWDQKEVIRSMERFAREVMPHFQTEAVPAAAAG